MMVDSLLYLKLELFYSKIHSPCNACVYRFHYNEFMHWCEASGFSQNDINEAKEKYKSSLPVTCNY